MATGMQERIRQKLAQALHPSALDIVNDSSRHAGHMGDDGSGESHFRVTIVSSAFTGHNRVARQRMVYDLLADEMKGGIHALSIKAMTPDEYAGV